MMWAGAKSRLAAEQKVTRSLPSQNGGAAKDCPGPTRRAPPAAAPSATSGPRRVRVVPVDARALYRHELSILIKEGNLEVDKVASADLRPLRCRRRHPILAVQQIPWPQGPLEDQLDTR